jgi:hypothetical protein
MDAAGRLGRERLAIGDREFAVGDRVVCLRNSDVLGVKNGTCATVEALDPGRGTLRIATDRGPVVELGRRYTEAGNLRHAYALTGHAAQGLTVQRAFVLGSGEARLQEWGYVALSRARAETRLYVTGAPSEHESHFHDLDDRDPLMRFGRALEESAIEELAIDQRPLPSGPRHEARPEIERPEITSDERTSRRLLERKKQALLETRARAEERLGVAEIKLGRRGAFLRRGREGLKAECELQRRAIALANERLTETDHLLDDSRLALIANARRARPAERARERAPDQNITLER